MFHATAVVTNAPPDSVPVVRIIAITESRWEAAEAMVYELSTRARSFFGHPTGDRGKGALFSSAAECFDSGADAVEFLDTRYEIKKMEVIHNAEAQ